ncbi:MAG: hypothetical protein K2Y16_07745 [Burkholderiales bacterium]|nr:hypothetical protein [Burkholderiales bacterium]
MAYTLEAFCSDARTILKADSSPAGVERVRKKMELLIRDPEFVREHFHDGVKYGPRRLFVDPELGFEVLGYRAEKARTSPAHDHGDSWALYGQVRDYTEMTEYNRLDDGKDPDNARLGIKSKYKLETGQVGMYWGSQLHSTFTPTDCCYLRLTGTDLEKRPRVRIDQNTGKIMK